MVSFTRERVRGLSCGTEEAPDPNAGRFGDDPGVDDTLGGQRGQNVLKCLFEELAARFLHQLNQVGAERVAVFLEKA